MAIDVNLQHVSINFTLKDHIYDVLREGILNVDIYEGDEALANAKEMFGKTLVTKQTGPNGKTVNQLYVEAGADIERELYLSILVDRETGKTSFVVST